MATYVPNANDLTQPTEDKELVTAAAEFRALKAKAESNETRIDALEGSALQVAAGRYLANASIDMAGHGIRNLATATQGNQAVSLSQVVAIVDGASTGLVALLLEERVAAAGQTVFSGLPFEYLVGSNNLAVYINGIRQDNGTAYTETNSTTVTFSEPLQAGDAVQFCKNESTTVNADSVLRVELRTPAPGKGAEIVAFKQSGAGSVPRTVQSKLNESVSVKDFGAVGDGVTDDGPAFLSWMAHLNANAPCRGHIPAGRYNLIAITGPLNILASGVSIEGDGSACTTLLYGYAFSVFLRKANASGRVEAFTVQGLSLEGPTADTTIAGYGQIPVFIYNASNIRLDDLRITKCPSLATAFRNCERITVVGCTFEEVARGGLNVSNSCYTSTVGCRFFKLGDDSISLHEAQGALQVSQHTVTGCTFYMGSGVKGLGTRNVACTGNTFEFMVGLVFDVRSVLPGDNEGSNATVNVVFSGNTVKDTFNTQAVSAMNSNRTIVRIAGDAANSTGLAAVPSYPNAAGNIIRPEGYVYNYSSATAAAAVPPSANIVIANNAVLQTLPEVPKFSDLGFGAIFSYEGRTYDPAVTFASLMDVDFVSLSGHLNNIAISGNIVSGVSRFGFFSEPTGYKLRLRNVSVSGNTVYAMRLCGFEASTSLDHAPDALDIDVSNNVFDIDPYLSNSNRNADGSWVAYGASSTNGIIFMARGNNLSQIRFRNNTIKNALGVGNVSMKDNLFICDVATINSFSTSNKGVGFVPYGEQVMLVDSTPTSPTYGSLINAQLQFSNSMPSTGKYVAGHVVRNTQPNPTGTPGSQYVIKEWLRLTTGSGHVSGTDWVEQRTLTGT